MKQIWIRASLLKPIALVKNGVVIDKGVEATINGPSKIIWDQKAQHPKVWIEIEDSVEITLIKE